MTKKELIDNIIMDVNITKSDAEKVFNKIFNVISEELENHNEVAIPSFGKFAISKREARSGINPKTKERIEIAASKGVKFKAAKQLKEKVNK